MGIGICDKVCPWQMAVDDMMLNRRSFRWNGIDTQKGNPMLEMMGEKDFPKWQG